MKYIVFWENYPPNGGAMDNHAMFSLLKSAKKFTLKKREEKGVDWIHIFDIKKDKSYEYFIEDSGCCEESEEIFREIEIPEKQLSPCCQTIGRIKEDNHKTKYYECVNCGQPFVFFEEKPIWKRLRSY